MQAAKHVPELRRANKAEVSEFFGVTLPTVNAWIARGCPVLQKGARGIPWVLDLLEVAQWRFQPQGDGDPEDPDNMTPKERLDWYKGEAEKRKLQITDGELVEASTHERQMSELLKVSISWAETMPDVMEREAGLTPEQVERLQAAVDRQRDRLHSVWAGDDV